MTKPTTSPPLHSRNHHPSNAANRASAGGVGVIVGEVMTSDVVTCRPNDTLEHCARIMWDLACGCVPVVDDQGRALSMITDRDVCMAAYIQGTPLSAITVSSMMSTRLFTARAGDTLSSCEATMRRHGIRRVPVIDNDDVVVGVLSFSDIVTHGHVGGPINTHESLSPAAIAETITCISHTRARSA